MALHYQTHYNLGRFGGRVTRRYEGPEAVVAIVVDVMLGVVLGLVGFVLRLAWGLAGAVVRFAVELVCLPMRAVRWSLARYAVRPATMAAAKGPWPAFEEVAAGR